MPKKFVDFTFSGTDVRVVEQLEVKQRALQEKLVDRMTWMMSRLQFKMRSKINAGKYSTGELAASVENPRAEVIENKIVGHLDYGDGVPYAKAVELGAVGHVEYAGGLLDQKGRLLKGKKSQFSGLGKEALKFYSAQLGKQVFADYVFKDKTEGKFYAKTSVDEMLDEFRNSVISALNETITEGGK